MRKSLKVLILCLSITLLFGCRKDSDKVIDKDLENNTDSHEIVTEKPKESEEEEEIEEANSEIEVDNKDVDLSRDKIVYEDDKYGFRLDLPASWKGTYVVEKKPWIDDINDSVEFNFNKDDLSSNIFTIVIMNESIEHEDWQELFLMYIVEKDGKTFSYLNVMEPTEELLKEENKDEFETVQEMVQEVPGIIESFTFVK